MRRVEALSPRSLEAYRDRLAERVQELSRGLAPDPVRLATGGGAVRRPHRREPRRLTRLHSHMVQMRGLLGGDEPAGRKMDFLVQEMHREVNTMGSKSQSAEIAAAGGGAQGRDRADAGAGPECRVRVTPAVPGPAPRAVGPLGRRQDHARPALRGADARTRSSRSPPPRVPRAARSRTGSTTISSPRRLSRSWPRRGELAEWAEVHGAATGPCAATVEAALGRGAGGRSSTSTCREGRRLKAALARRRGDRARRAADAGGAGAPPARAIDGQ